MRLGCKNVKMHPRTKVINFCKCLKADSRAEGGGEETSEGEKAVGRFLSFTFNQSFEAVGCRNIPP